MFPSSLIPFTATPGGGRATAVKLNQDENLIGVCATAGDSVMLPPWSVAATCDIYHIGAQPAQVFPALASDTIQGVSGSVGYRQPPGKASYVALANNNWAVYNAEAGNFAAVTDPTVANDSTQGYTPGSPWFNIANGREWTCQSSIAGAAVWYISGIIPGVGAEPSSLLTQFGSAAFGQPFFAFGEEGNLYRNIGNPVGQNAADLTDDILDGFVMPANSFDIAKRGLQFSAQGKFAATANNKRFKVWANPAITGGTITNGVNVGGVVTGPGTGALLFDSGVQTGNNVGWAILLQIFKYGVASSNTQYVQGQPIYGTAHGGVLAPQFTTLVESAAINFVVTGSSPTTGAAGDVVLNFTEANAMN